MASLTHEQFCSTEGYPPAFATAISVCARPEIRSGTEAVSWPSMPLPAAQPPAATGYTVWAKAKIKSVDWHGSGANGGYAAGDHAYTER